MRKSSIRWKHFVCNEGRYPIIYLRNVRRFYALFNHSPMAHSVQWHIQSVRCFRLCTVENYNLWWTVHRERTKALIIAQNTYQNIQSKGFTPEKLNKLFPMFFFAREISHILYACWICRMNKILNQTCTQSPNASKIFSF